MPAQLRTSWCAPSAAGPKQAHQYARSHEDADLDPPHPADRQAETKDVPISARLAAKALRSIRKRREAGHDTRAQRKPRQHQPLIDGACIARSRDAEGGRAEMAEDQHPVQCRIAGNAARSTAITERVCDSAASRLRMTAKPRKAGPPQAIARK